MKLTKQNWIFEQQYTMDNCDDYEYSMNVLPHPFDQRYERWLLSEE